MSYTITLPDGNFAMRIVRIKAGQYRLDVNIAPLCTDAFFKSLKRIYHISSQPTVEGDKATFDLELSIIGYQFERDHLRESLTNLYDSALAIHQNQYYFTPRISPQKGLKLYVQS